MTAERRATVSVGAIVVLGAALRLRDLGGPSLWLDEILHLEIVQRLEGPWYRALLHLPGWSGDAENGPLYYALQALGQRLAPGDAGTRLLPALAGVLTLTLMALVGRRLGGTTLALTATFVLAVSPLHVYFSREGRPYALVMGLALLLLLALLEATSRRGRSLGWVGCLLAAWIGVHTIPILVAFALAATLTSLTARDRWRARARRLAHPVAAAALALALIWTFYLRDSEVNRPDAAPTAAKAEVQAEVEASSWFQSPISKRSLAQLAASMTTAGDPGRPLEARSWLLLGFAALGAGALFRRRRDHAMAAGAMAVLPALLAILALAAVGRWYGVRYTSAALPAFTLLVAAGIVATAGAAARRFSESDGRRRTLTAVVAAGLIALAVAPNLVAAHQDPRRKADWRDVARFVDAVALPGEAVLAANAWPKVCLAHYLRRRGRDDLEVVELWERVDLAEAAVAERERGFLITAGFRRSGAVRAWMHRYPKVLGLREEEIDLFYFPAFLDLYSTRVGAGRGTVFTERFAAHGHRFDFAPGDPGLLGPGWYATETMPDGTSFQWTSGDAVLALPIGAPRDARIRLRALPFVYPDVPPQRLTLELDGKPLATVDLPARWSEHEIAAPADAWRAGPGLLVLRAETIARPADVLDGAGDTRRLAVALDWLEVVF